LHISEVKTAVVTGLHQTKQAKDKNA